MAGELTCPEPGELITKENGQPETTWWRVFKRLVDGHNTTNANLSSTDSGLATKAIAAQKEYGCWTFAFPSDGTQFLALNLSHQWTITKVTTKTSAGTATCTVKIDGVALGGTANSASASQEEQAHASANVAAAGSDVTVTFASTSADCADLTIAVEGTRTLATS